MTRRFTLLHVAEPAVTAIVAVALARPLHRAGFAPAGVLDGPLGLALLGLGAAVSAARSLRRLPPGAGVRRGLDALAARAVSPRPLFAALFLAYLALGHAYTSRLRVSGDEPHYLIMAQSLWREGDLDLRDNYEREDWREHTPGPIRPHYAAPRKDGRPFPAHAPGLPAILALPYAVARRFGTVVVLAAVAALAAVLAGRLAGRCGATPPGPAVAAAAGPPLLFYSFHAYTEGASALAVVAAAWAVAGPPSVRAAVVAGIAAGALPWLHLKMAPASVVIGVAALATLRGRALAAFAGVAGASALLFVTYSMHVFGTPTPLAIYGGMPRDMDGRPVVAAAGLLLDRSFGLLPYAPVFVLALAGLAGLARSGRGGVLSIALFAAVIAPVLGWRMWWGGQCPPARFLVPALPLLAVAAAVHARSGRGLARWWPWLFATGVALALRLTIQPGELLLVNRGGRATRAWEALAGSVDPQRFLPSLVAAEAGDVAVAGVWAAALVLLIGLDRLAQRRDAVDAGFRTLAGPLVALAVTAALAGAAASASS